MDKVQFGDEQDSSVLYSEIAKSNTPPGIVAWIADKLHVSRPIVALVLIMLSLAAIVAAFMIPALIIENNKLVDPSTLQ